MGYFARMILEKLRQDFLDIYPNKTFIRNSYIKDLQINEIKFNNYIKQSIIKNQKNDILKTINQNILSTKLKKKGS